MIGSVPGGVDRGGRLDRLEPAPEHPDAGVGDLLVEGVDLGEHALQVVARGLSSPTSVVHAEHVLRHGRSPRLGCRAGRSTRSPPRTAAPRIRQLPVLDFLPDRARPASARVSSRPTRRVGYAPGQPLTDEHVNLTEERRRWCPRAQDPGPLAAVSPSWPWWPGWRPSHGPGRRARRGRRCLRRPPGRHEVQEDHLARHPGRLRHADLRERQDQEQEGQEARRRPAAEAALGLAEGRQGQDQRQGPVPPQGQDHLVPQEDQDAGRRAGHPQGRGQHQQGAAASRSTRPTPRRARSGRGPGSRRATRCSSTPALRCAGGSTPSTPPTGSSPRYKTALRQLGAATGIRFKYAGKTKAIPGSSARGPATPTWSSPGPRPSQTKWNLLRQHDRSRRPDPDRDGPHRQGQARPTDHPLRPGARQHASPRPPASPDPTPAARSSSTSWVTSSASATRRDAIQQMYPSAVNTANGIYQAGDLAGSAPGRPLDRVPQEVRAASAGRSRATCPRRRRRCAWTSGCPGPS